MQLIAIIAVAYWLARAALQAWKTYQAGHHLIWVGIDVVAALGLLIALFVVGL